MLWEKRKKKSFFSKATVMSTFCLHVSDLPCTQGLLAMKAGKINKLIHPPNM